MIKKILYMILLAAEFVVGFGTLVLGTVATGWLYFMIISAVWAAAMLFLLIKQKQAASTAKKRNRKVAIALVMLFPFVAAMTGMFWVAFTITC